MQPQNRNAALSPAASGQEFAFTDLWLILRKRRWLLLAMALISALLATAYGVHRGEQFTAEGNIRIQPGSASSFKQSISSALGSGGTLDDTLESDIRILSSEQLLMKVVATLKLQDNSDFLGGATSYSPKVLKGQSVPLLHGDLNNPYTRSKLISILRGGLAVERIPRTEIVRISYVSSSPQMSADIVNALESEFIKNNFTSHYSTMREVTNWLGSQIDDLRAVVRNSQDQMVDLQKKLGVSALDPSHSMVVQDVVNLQKGVADATQQRVTAEARYRILQSLSPDQMQDVPGAQGSDPQLSVLANLRLQRAADAAELARLQPLYGPNYPQVKQTAAHLQSLDKEIAQQQSRILTSARDALNVAQAEESQAKNLLQSHMQEIYGQSDDVVQYALVSQEYDSNRRMYESILVRLREAAVDAGLDSADISIVDAASLPVQPSSMSPKKLGAMGLFCGFLLGLILAILLEQLDTRMRDSKHIQEVLGLSALAIVPQGEWKGKQEARESQTGPEILWDARSSFAEAIRVFRTSIQLSSAARQSRVIAITSCQPDEGKSTVSTNLAAALAQGGKRVVLVDTDMRRPSVYWRLGLTNKHGLSEYLTGNETLESVIQTHQTIPTLDMIPSGFSPPLPADLLASDEMRRLVEYLRERYEYVIFDTPPALSVTDPLIVGSLADGMVMVIRQGFCTRAMLHRAAEIFSDVDVKLYGFVLNGVDASLPEYYGYLGYYSYEYKN